MSATELKLEEGAYFDFVTHHPTTAAVTDADTTPTAEVFEDATDTTVVSLTVTKRTSKTGNYRVLVTAAAASGFEAGKSYNVIASATVNSVAGKGVVGWFKVRARGTDDLAYPATSGRSMVVDASGLVDANAVKVGPSGSGTAQTARDLGGTLGAAGAGLTALGDSRIANLDATVSSRTKPADTQARVTLVDTATTLTNDPGGVTTLLSRLTALRAGYLDNLSGGAVALASSLTTLASAVAALNNLSQSDIRSAVGLTLANLDTQLAAIASYVDTEVAAIKAQTDKLTFDAGNLLAANVKKVNDLGVKGTGTDNDPWNPA